MSPEQITALITGIVAIITAVTALVAAFRLAPKLETVRQQTDSMLTTLADRNAALQDVRATNVELAARPPAPTPIPISPPGAPQGK